MSSLVWAAAAAGHLGLAVAATVLGATAALDDRADLGMSAYPAVSIWASIALVWVVAAVEYAAAAAAVLAAAAAWTADLAARGVYPAFWLIHLAALAGLTAACLLWAGAVDVAAVVAQSAVIAVVPGMLAAIAELLWALEARRVRVVGWDRTAVARAAWAVLVGAWVFVLLSMWTFAERAAAAVSVRGDAYYVVAVMVLLAAASAAPVAFATCARALDGYFTPDVNRRQAVLRTVVAAALRGAAVIVLLVAFARHARKSS